MSHNHVIEENSVKDSYKKIGFSETFVFYVFLADLYSVMIQ